MILCLSFDEAMSLRRALSAQLRELDLTIGSDFEEAILIQRDESALRRILAMLQQASPRVEF
jgi:hypothetical protein